MLWTVHWLKFTDTITSHRAGDQVVTVIANGKPVNT